MTDPSWRMAPPDMRINGQGHTMDYEIPLSIFTGVYEDLTNPRNNLLGYFAQIDRPGIERILAERYSGLGPEGYGLSRYLALLLRVKQNIVSDRRLVADLATNELYRRAIGLGSDPRRVPGRSALSSFRARLGVEGFLAAHRHTVMAAHAEGLTMPAFPGLARNRRPGIIASVDGTFLRAYCHQHPSEGPDGQKRFSDESAAYGRRHHIYRYPVGHKAHTLMAAGGLPLVSVVAPANELDQNHLIPLLLVFRELYPELEVAYLLLDKGYDAEFLYRAVYEDFGMIPVTARKQNVAYPKGFTPQGRPLCAYGIELARRGTDYQRRRTKFSCEHRCRAHGAAPEPGFERCEHLGGAGAGYTYYTHFDWSYRKFGPLTPDMVLHRQLYKMRTEIERSFGLKKANRYRMEDTITVMGLDPVAIHVILHDTAVVIDCMQRAAELRTEGEVTPRR